MKKFIFIAGINRSGGSLLARLFDGHENTASYPMETGFKYKKDIYGFIDKITGSPTYIPKFSKNLNFIEYFEAKKEDAVFKWGKESAEKLGIRENYLEKAYYEKNIKTNFDYESYTFKLTQYCKEAQNNQDLYIAKHQAYFEAWDEGKNVIDPKVVISHDSGGLFLNNFEDYFNDFPDSIVVAPIRDIFGYVAAEKTRIARRYFGSRRFSKPSVPNFLIKYFDEYDIDAIIRTWSVAVSRVRLLQEKFGVKGNFIVYRFENLVESPKSIIDYICQKIDLKKNSILYEPTLMGKPWLGNSQQGTNSGINKNPNNYYTEVLSKEEIDIIYKKTKKITKELNSINSCPVDLTKINVDKFFDYSNQKKYSDNNDNWSLYCAFAFSGFRKLKLKNISILSLVALIFKITVRILHIPRLFKLRYLKGLGKQNYT